MVERIHGRSLGVGRTADGWAMMAVGRPRGRPRGRTRPCPTNASPSSPAPAGASARASPSSWAPAGPPSTSPVAASTPGPSRARWARPRPRSTRWAGRASPWPATTTTTPRWRRSSTGSRQEQGRLDVLVNNVYSAPDLVPWLGKSYWELPIEAWDQVIDIGTRSHYVASVLRHAAAVRRRRRAHRERVVVGCGHLRPQRRLRRRQGGRRQDDRRHGGRPGGHRASAWCRCGPGWCAPRCSRWAPRDDGDQAYIELPGEGRFDLSGAESPRFLGRAVVALAGDPGRRDRSGRAFTSAGLARELGFTDVDGRVPEVLLRPDA